MTYMNSGANVRQFQLLRFINENSLDEHVVSKISIVLRRDKIEAPYYMTSNVRISSCIDMPDEGLVHAMDMLNHNRMHNLTQEKYSEIRSLIDEAFDGESEQVKILREENRLKVVIMTRSHDEFMNLFEDCRELFDKIDGLVG